MLINRLSILVIAAASSFGAVSGQGCPQDILTCPDGQSLNRDPMNNCQFPPCAQNCDDQSTGEGTNYLICRNGALTTRDPSSNCEFTPCDGGCNLQDYRQCPAPNLNFYVARDPNTNCASYLSCPSTADPSNPMEPVPELQTTANGGDPPMPETTSSVDAKNMCSQDVLVCSTGEIYNRDPYDNCNFPSCPKNCDSSSTGSGTNYLRCPDTTWRARDPSSNCDFYSCGSSLGSCMSDAKQCSSPYLNIYVARNPNSGCSYLSCPQTCTGEINECGQSRDPLNGCNFPGCPSNPIEPNPGNPIEPTKCNGFTDDCKKCLNKQCAYAGNGVCYDDCSDINRPNGVPCYSYRDYDKSDCKNFPGPSPMADTSAANSKRVAATVAACFVSAVVVPALL